MKGEHLITHGMSGTLEHSKWRSMKARCRDARQVYHRGKGILVCAEWQNDFPAFLNHIGPMPSPQHTVDRWPNPDGNYEPGNVRWATVREQANNRSSNRWVEYLGKKMSLSDAVVAAGNVVSPRLAWMRLYWNWDVSEAVENPPRKGNYRRKANVQETVRPQFD